MANRKVDINPLNSIGSILVLVLMFVGLFFVAKGVFWVLSWLAPVFLILTLVIDYKVIVNYGKWILKMLQTNLIVGIGAVLLTIFGFPIVSGFLLGKALLSRKLKQTMGQFEGQQGRMKEKDEFATYEEITDEPDIDEPLDLNTNKPKVERPEVIIKKKSSSSNYEDLFE